MADQFENQLPQKNDAKWVRALDASGNPILISKEDLASVVGELLPETSDEKKGLMPVFYRKFIKPFNVPTINSYAVHIASVIKHISYNSLVFNVIVSGFQAGCNIILLCTSVANNSFTFSAHGYGSILTRDFKILVVEEMSLYKIYITGTFNNSSTAGQGIIIAPSNNFINLFEGNDTERVSNLNIKDEIVLKDIIK